MKLKLSIQQPCNGFYRENPICSMQKNTTTCLIQLEFMEGRGRIPSGLSILTFTRP